MVAAVAAVSPLAAADPAIVGLLLLFLFRDL
jgi:hypothetical protein